MESVVTEMVLRAAADGGGEVGGGDSVGVIRTVKT